MTRPEATTRRSWNLDNDSNDDDNASGSGEATTTTTDDEDDNTTNNYSSYWQSIPDPPTLATAATASSNSVASEEEEVTTTATLRGGTTLRTLTATSSATTVGTNNDEGMSKKPSGATSSAMVKGGMQRIRNCKLHCGDSTTFAFRDLTNRRRCQNSNDNSLKNNVKKVEKGNKTRKNKRHGTSLSIPSDNDDKEGILKIPVGINSHYAVSSVDASLSLERVDSLLKKTSGGVDSQAVSVDTMEAENVDSGKNTKNQMAENEIHSGSTALMKVSGGPVGASKEERLIQLVRDYCSLPLKHCIHSTESQEIQFLASHPVANLVFITSFNFSFSISCTMGCTFNRNSSLLLCKGCI